MKIRMRQCVCVCVRLYATQCRSKERTKASRNARKFSRIIIGENSPPSRANREYREYWFKHRGARCIQCTRRHSSSSFARRGLFVVRKLIAYRRCRRSERIVRRTVSTKRTVGLSCSFSARLVSPLYCRAHCCCSLAHTHSHTLAC